MTPTATPLMPMGEAAMKAASGPANLLPPMPSGGVPPPPAVAPAAPPMGAPAQIGMPTFADPSAPTTPPYQTRTQADGTIAIVWPSPDGDPSKDIISQVFPMPKIPPALQPPKQAAQ